MAERIVSMHAAYRSGKEVVDGFLSRPTAGGQRGAIVLVHGYRGLDDGQRAVTRRFAREGFVCLSPDLFSRQDLPHARRVRAQENFPRYSAGGEPDRRQRAIPAQAPLGGIEEGRGAWLLHGRRPGALRARSIQGVSCGRDLLSEPVPDPEDLRGIAAPLLCHYGTDDPGTTKTEIEMFCETLERYKKKYEIEMYEGAGHAFLNNPQSKTAANREAADKSVVRTAKWLRKVLA